MIKIKTLAGIVGLALPLLFVLPLLAVEPLRVPRAKTPPVIDGKLDDAVWATALKLTDFKTFKPDFGKEPSQKTEGYILYDDENIYFGFRAYDSEPQKIKAAISKRDAIDADDYCGVFLDTSNTSQSAYAFMVNPFGIQADGILNQSGNMDEKFDTVWYSQGQIDALGYTAEIRVPLQSLRFPGGKEIIMTAFFFRQIVRTSEMDSSPAFYPNHGAVLSQGQPVVFSDLKYKRVIEFLPAVTHTLHYTADQGSMKRDENKTALSLTAKLGLTSDLTLDGAVNPDFSQVESDAGQIDFNRRYALYYPEKRPFFLEGNEIFAFAAASEDSYYTAAVYTRTIVQPIFGLKLNGKLGTANTIAAIYARDDFTENAESPHPAFSIVRFKHALSGDGFLGAFYTARGQGEGYNRVVGADGRVRLSSVSTAEFHLFGSASRPLDSRSSTGGYAGAAMYSYSTRNVNLQFTYEDISKDFQVDTGFLQRTGFRSLTSFIDYIFYPKSSFFQTIEPFYWSSQLYDTTSNLLETTNNFTLRFGLPRSSQLRVDGILASEVFESRRFNRSAWRIWAYSQITKQVYIQGYFRRGGMVFYNPDVPYQGYGNDSQLNVDYQPTQQLDLTLNLAYTDFFRKSDGAHVYTYTILRGRSVYQLNRYLFLRAILEYNDFRKRLTLDTLISFTYIPGTVVFFGYGSAFEKVDWNGEDYVAGVHYRETQRGFFFKISYLWRL